ncbi:MAG: TetR/AcrR family transcriptional regulator [Clostridium sp.]|uniref:TetR/AcrR family transcriptional regulator n=1 Tax=Clostridium sp. TaxID=1506 RepID=UPI0030475EC9
MKLREEKKELTRKAIIKSSEMLFEKNGFSNTKTSDIAKNANVAEGTIFNYFLSKTDLFINSVLPSISSKENDININEEINRKNLISLIMKIVDSYLRDICRVDKNLLKDFLSIMYLRNVKENYEVTESVLYIDKLIIDNIIKVLDNAKKNKVFNSNIKIDTLVKCIYGLVNLEFNGFILTNDYSYEKMFFNIEDGIKFILEEKIKAPNN